MTSKNVSGEQKKSPPQRSNLVCQMEVSHVHYPPERRGDRKRAIELIAKMMVPELEEVTKKWRNNKFTEEEQKAIQLIAELIRPETQKLYKKEVKNENRQE